MPNAVFYSINDLIEMGLVGSRTTASKLIKEGEIPAIKLGRRVLIPADELEQSLAAHRISSGAADTSQGVHELDGGAYAWPRQ